jgi:hypothetical protein
MILCTGGVSYALFISMLISKLFCTKSEGGGGESPLEGVGPENHIKLATCTTEYRIQNTAAAKLMYIKLPMYLFFIWRFDLMNLMGGQIHYLGHWKGWALKISTFLGPNGTHWMVRVILRDI